MRNIEIKCPLPDRARIEDRLLALGARRVGLLRQRDTFFAVPDGHLKLREEEGERPRLIAYRRAPVADRPRPSDYGIEEVDDARAWIGLLSRVLPIEAVVEKERVLWTHRHTRIHLDRVHGLGDYLELETVVQGIDEADARAECQLLIEGLGLSPAEFIGVAYRDLCK